MGETAPSEGTRVKSVTLKERAGSSASTQLLSNSSDILNGVGSGEEQEITEVFTDDELDENEATDEDEDEKQRRAASLAQRNASDSSRLCSEEIGVDKRPDSLLDTIDGDPRSDSSSSQLSGIAFANVEGQNSPVYMRVSAVVPEELSISYADDIFRSCASKYQVFIDTNEEFKAAVASFVKSIPTDKENPELEDCFTAYCQLLRDEQNNSIEG